MAFLKQKKVHLEIVENEEDFNENFFRECQKRYRPDAIMIEYNGMWDAERVFNIKLPRRWGIVQVIVTVDTTTFTSYWNNMRSLMHLSNFFTKSSLSNFIQYSFNSNSSYNASNCL